MENFEAKVRSWLPSWLRGDEAKNNEQGAGNKNLKVLSRELEAGSEEKARVHSALEESRTMQSLSQLCKRVVLNRVISELAEGQVDPTKLEQLCAIVGDTNAMSEDISEEMLFERQKQQTIFRFEVYRKVRDLIREMRSKALSERPDYPDRLSSFEEVESRIGAQIFFQILDAYTKYCLAYYKERKNINNCGSFFFAKFPSISEKCDAMRLVAGSFDANQMREVVRHGFDREGLIQELEMPLDAKSYFESFMLRIIDRLIVLKDIDARQFCQRVSYESLLNIQRGIKRALLNSEHAQLDKDGRKNLERLHEIFSKTMASAL